MYHPAAALYNPNLRDVLKKDFKQLKNFLDNRPKVSKAKQEEIDAILQL